MHQLNKIPYALLLLLTLSTSCKKFLEIGPPKDKIPTVQVFQNDQIATSAITGIYSRMAIGGFSSGNGQSVTILSSLSADELQGYSTQQDYYSNNEIPSSDANILTLWSGPYAYIYSANAILAGLDASTALTPATLSQLKGEALFVRAFNYFYLVNLFGAVPLDLATDYQVNQVASRAPVSAVYQQIISDLTTAEGLLTDTYVSTERIRPNKAAVQALLARCYLYTQDWANAEKYATLVINKTSVYSLTALNAVFLKNSTEAIWQLMPPANTNTLEGNNFIFSITPFNVSLKTAFVTTAFEPNDNRRTSWVGTLVNASGTYYYPFKYKVQSSATVTEYSMVLRLAEQYLIRAEARANQTNLSGAITDVDVIRNRAGLLLIKNTNPTIGQTDLLTAIQQERRVELFTEWGHRWLDLKRTGQANAVLAPIKGSTWQATDVLYPIPNDEISRNHNMIQNPGY
jgi:hypothetical protein